MKILTFFDPHVSTVAPGARIDDYFQTCLNKLSEIRDLSLKHDCDLVLCSGDFFNLKAANRNPYSMVSTLIDLFKSFKVPVKSIYGNHDLAAGDDQSIDKQPFGVLCKAANIELFRKDKEYWLDEETALTATPYYAEIDISPNDYLPKRVSKSKVHIHLTHGNLFPTTPIYSPATCYASVANCEADYILNGHIHENLGSQKVGNVQVVNTGSMTRGSLTESNINRQPSIFILDTKTGKEQIIPLTTALPADKIFDLKRYEQLEHAEEEITKLGELIKRESENVELNGPESIRQLVRDMPGIDEKTRDTIKELLDRAEESV